MGRSFGIPKEKQGIPEFTHAKLLSLSEGDSTDRGSVTKYGIYFQGLRLKSRFPTLTCFYLRGFSRG
jgi:hypothetical protein